MFSSNYTIDLNRLLFHTLCTPTHSQLTTNMASKKSNTHQSLALLLFFFFFFLFTLSSAHAKGVLAVYWGQTMDEGTLTATCDTGNYDIVILAFLTTFGCGQTPAWNFDGHCGSESSCDKLQPEIEHCQLKGVKVFLSLGGRLGRYFLCSPDDAGRFADYLYTNFLSGQGGPLGSVSLDGIDFDIETGSKLYCTTRKYPIRLPLKSDAKSVKK